MKSGTTTEAEIQQCEVEKEKKPISQENDLEGKSVKMSSFVTKSHDLDRKKRTIMNAMGAL